MRDFHAVMRELLNDIRKQRPAESSIAAHLLDVKDPDTGARMCSCQAVTLAGLQACACLHVIHCLRL